MMRSAVGYGVTAEDFAVALADVNSATIHLRINSPGGDVFEARAIQVALKQHKAKVIAHIDGLAASAATYIALAADEVEMAEGAFFMIHNAWTMGLGNANDFEELAGMLHKVDDSIVKDYQRKTAQAPEQIKQWMDSETWFTAEEANEHGFADRIYSGEDDTENSSNWDLSAYTNTPTNLIKIESPIDDSKQKVQEHRNNLMRRVNMLEAIAY
jgi:ATP-dependent Clp protease protease subunit